VLINLLRLLLLHVFKTQNTGGLPLSGPDWIDAHLLNAIAKGAQQQWIDSAQNMGRPSPSTASGFQQPHGER
jgi:hypothetical protein